ncbi:PHP domain [uncultured Eubacterium sp.]|nr:PHP domain [uncultured Eubacterium sp.]
MIDLHIHSTCSDGTFAPKEITDKVIEKNLYGFSLTDHDTVDGISEILSMNLPEHLKFIPGIEISCDALHREIHILGYGIDCKNQQLNKTLNDLRKKRMQRNLDMIDLFQKDGYPVTLEKLQHGDPDTVITRAHFSRVLVEEGICTSRDQAFSKYLGEKCKYYIPKTFFDPKDCLKLILDAGGIPILAHPFLYKFSNKDTKHLIRDLKEYGLAGIEVYHSSHHQGQVAKLREWQKEYDLLATGGSDFHGTNKPDIDIGTGRGPLYVPDHLLDELLEYQK